MAIGHIEGTIGYGSTGSYAFGRSDYIDIPANSTGGYTVTYEFWIVFAGQNAYKVYVNGIEAYPGAGFLQSSATWVLKAFAQSYDCINGACIKKTVFNTPGLYPTLADCEVACGTGCSGKCISNSDWSQIEGLAGQLKNRNCS